MADALRRSNRTRWVGGPRCEWGARGERSGGMDALQGSDVPWLVPWLLKGRGIRYPEHCMRQVSEDLKNPTKASSSQ